MNIFEKILVAGTLISAFATCEAVAQQPLKYVDALQFRMINKGFEDTETPYTRIPMCLKDSVRPDLWNRSQCSSGLGIRFATDSKRVGVRYTLLWDTHMFHMADTGLKGTDLYILTEDDTPMPVLGDLLDALPRSERKGIGVYLSLAQQDMPDSPEGYVLTVGAKQITLRARTEAGLFYGCQTLEQLMEDSRDFGQGIPPMTITDYPAIAYGFL